MYMCTFMYKRYGLIEMVDAWAKERYSNQPLYSK